MVLDGLRGYLQIAGGLTDVTRQRAQAVATSLTTSGEALTALVTQDVRGQVGGLAEEILATSKANRELLLSLVRSEVERQVARLGLVPSSELEAATARADRLEARLRKLETQVDRPGAGVAAERSAGGTRERPVDPSEVTPATKKPAAKKAAAKKAAGNQTAGSQAAANQTAANQTPANQTPAGQIPVGKTAAPRPAGAKNVLKKAAASAGVEPAVDTTGPDGPGSGLPVVGPDGGVL